MSTAFNTSRVFEASRKMKERLDNLAWPTPKPRVGFADVDIDAPGDLVQIVPDFGDDAEISWRSMPNGRDERFDIVVHIVVFGDPDEDVLVNRLEELADLVQRAFYDDQSTTIAETERITPLGITAAVKLEGVGQVAFQVYAAGADGRVGECWIRYRVAFRI